MPAATPPTRRRWGSLSRDRIVAAALELARREGVDGVTIRRLAGELGASRMAMYRHVPDKDTLLDLVLDAIAEELAVPTSVNPEAWPERLRLLVHRIRRQLLAYPGLAGLLLRRRDHGPGGHRVAEAVLGTLAEAGLDGRAATRYYLILMDVILGRVLREVHGDPTALAHAGGNLPHLRAAAPHLRATTAEEILDAELDIIIRAITAQLSTSS